MKKFIFFFLLVLFCLTTPFAHAAKKIQAQKLDMSKATCNDIALDDVNELVVLVSWIDGYMSAKSGDMVLDLKTIEENLEHIVKTCSEDKKFKIKGFFAQ